MTSLNQSSFSMVCPNTILLQTSMTSVPKALVVHSTDPVAIYQVDKVLPEAIFGTDIPSTPAPAPAPDISPAADTPSANSKSSSSTKSSPSNSSSHRIMNLGIWSQLVLGVIGGLVLFF
ncbi:hypothetical protein PTKIN_Ptkin12aG0067900 [Pterospermum kingtungense]